MFGSDMNLITVVIGFGMSVTFILFICTRIICRRIRDAQSRQMFQTDSGFDLEQPGLVVRGLEPVVVAAIPTLRFNREAFSSIEDAQCSICLGDYQEREVLRIMPKCGHNFHLSCIDIWLRKQSTCPVCRVPLQDFSDAKHMRPAASFRMNQTDQSMDSPETSAYHSRQWLLPGSTERSTQNQIDQPHIDPAARNSEMNRREAET